MMFYSCVISQRTEGWCQELFHNFYSMFKGLECIIFYVILIQGGEGRGVLQNKTYPGTWMYVPSNEIMIYFGTSDLLMHN